MIRLSQESQTLYCALCMKYNPECAWLSFSLGLNISQVGAYEVLRSCVLLNKARRLAKWKRDAQYWFIQDSLRNESLLRPVAEDFVRAFCSVLPKRKDDGYVHQAKKVDRPCFGATLLNNQDKYPLSERERAWLLGDVAYVL